jgi:hypothetical protein
MVIHTAVSPVIALLAGILILLVPQSLNFIVAIYLIVIGILGLVAHM